jgi:NAD(P)H-nitrite reductase large subunit
MDRKRDSKKGRKKGMSKEKDLIICRCEEVTKGEILDAIDAGAETLNEVKRLTRAGMGLCQGRICRRLLTQIYARETGQRPDKIRPTTFRPPVRPLTIETLATGVESMDLGKDYDIE